MLMGSLQEQLLKAGLVSEQKAKQLKTKKRKQSRSPKRGESESDLARAYAERARREQAERDRALNAKREEQRRRKAQNAALKQLVVPASRNDPKAELSRFFQHLGKIRKLHVTRAQIESLNSGTLGVVYLQGRYHLVEPEILAKAQAIKPDAVVDVSGGGETEEQVEGYEDERYQVPDDLVW